MAEKVIMPKQGLQMTEGTIRNWLIKEGETCEEGKPLFEMETDKLTITMDSPASGTLLKIVRGEGETVPITEIIAVIWTPGEDISAILKEAAAQNNAASQETEAPSGEAPAAQAPSEAAAIIDGAAQSTPKIPGKFTTPRARMRAAEKGTDIASIPGSGPEGLVIEKDVLSYVPQQAPSPKATPLAKKMAELEGVDLKDAKGTGSYGKITKNDIMAAVQARVEAVTGNAVRETRVVPMSNMRKVIARRMVESLQTEAQLQHMVTVDMTNAGKLREAYKKKGKKVSYNDIVLLATSRALMEFPMLNASVDGDNIVYHDYVNLGMAVAVKEGLIVPNLKNADLMHLEEISAMAKELAGKAKDNTLQLSEMTEGTFTVSNLGMYGLDSFTGIINPPESGIIALGKIQETPVVVDHEIAIRPMMSMTLSYDHRVVDGAPAAEFLVRVKEYIEEPTLML